MTAVPAANDNLGQQFPSTKMHPSLLQVLFLSRGPRDWGILANRMHFRSGPMGRVFADLRTHLWAATPHPQVEPSDAPPPPRKRNHLKAVR